MKLRLQKYALGLALLGGGVAGCVHTPAGTSVEIALARRPEVVNFPKLAAPVTPADSRGTASVRTGPVEPEKMELVADAFSRGEFCMKTGADEEAIAAFREAVKLDPKFGQAWNNLAALYERTGNDKLAMEAFRKAKTQ